MDKDKKIIYVIIKMVYGNQRIYPTCLLAKNLCKILGKKTMTTEICLIFKLFGYELQQKLEHKEL